MRNKLQTIKTDDEAKMNRERDEAKTKFDDLKNKCVILRLNIPNTFGGPDPRVIDHFYEYLVLWQHDTLTCIRA
jgi:hypothetical protein